MSSTTQLNLLFPVDYQVAGKGWTQSGRITIAAPHGRAVRLLAIEEIMRRCGVRPTKLKIGAPL